MLNRWCSKLMRDITVLWIRENRRPFRFKKREKSLCKYKWRQCQISRLKIKNWERSIRNNWPSRLERIRKVGRWNLSRKRATDLRTPIQWAERTSIGLGSAQLLSVKWRKNRRERNLRKKRICMNIIWMQNWLNSPKLRLRGRLEKEFEGVKKPKERLLMNSWVFMINYGWLVLCFFTLNAIELMNKLFNTWIGYCPVYLYCMNLSILLLIYFLYGHFTQHRMEDFWKTQFHKNPKMWQKLADVNVLFFIINAL